MDGSKVGLRQQDEVFANQEMDLANFVSNSTARNGAKVD